MDNRLLEDRNELPTKSKPECLPCGVGRTPLAASSHRLRLGLCLVGPDVKLVGAGAGLVGLVWFVGPLCWYDAVSDILCIYVASFRLFWLYSGYGCLQSKNHQNSWKWLALSPITTFGA